MTYRLPSSRRWKYPPLLCLCAAGFGLAWFLYRSSGTLFFYPIGLSIAGAIYLIRESWLDWTTQVTVDDVGIRWTRGSVNVAMRWEEISGLGHRYEQRAGRGTLVVGVVRGRTRILHPLPIVPPELYDELKNRLGGLPPTVESRFLARWGDK
jgi:hypothetical protein